MSAWISEHRPAAVAGILTPKGGEGHGDRKSWQIWKTLGSLGLTFSHFEMLLLPWHGAWKRGNVAKFPADGSVS